jgi:hypothetical protein
VEYGLTRRSELHLLEMVGMATTFTILSVMALLLLVRAVELS